MSEHQFTLHASVYIILIKNDKILLLRRFNTGWQDGMYSLPAGHIDGGEKITATMIREAKEETGIVIQPEDLSVVHTVHHVDDKEFVDFYLKAKKWEGIPSNAEPEKADEMGWFSLDNLPDNLLPNVRDVLHRYVKGETFSEFWWK